MTQFKNAYVLNVVSDDHPGIVASVGDVIEKLKGNVDSVSQTVLKGYFTLIMVISLPEAIEADALAEEVRKLGGKRMGLQVIARAFQHRKKTVSSKPVERFVVTAFGRDTPGVLLRFSQYLAGKDINIIDLYGNREKGDFILVSQVEIPPRWDIGMLQAELEEIGREMAFTVRLQHENIFVATNQLRLSRTDAPQTPDEAGA
jgi:glycine cleavage system transcriptional repressor